MLGGPLRLGVVVSGPDCLVFGPIAWLISTMNKMCWIWGPHRLLLAHFLAIHMRKSLSFRVHRSKSENCAKWVRWFYQSAVNNSTVLWQSGVPAEASFLTKNTIGTQFISY